MRLARCAALTVFLVALPAAQAASKEGVRAKAEGRVNLQARPGDTVRVAWRLADARGRPFGAGGIYLRVSMCGGRRPLHIATTARRRGRYAATVRVPAGRGLRRLDVGLRGWRTYPGGRRERADLFFAFDPPLTRRCPG